MTEVPPTNGTMINSAPSSGLLHPTPDCPHCEWILGGGGVGGSLPRDTGTCVIKENKNLRLGQKRLQDL